MPNRLTTVIPTHSSDTGAETLWTSLRRSGAVLVREAAESVAAFGALTEQFATRFRIHQDPARQRYAGDDTTQGVASGAGFIDLHAERSYLPAPPELLFFCCLTPASRGGATMVCDGAAVVAALPDDQVRRLDDVCLVWRTRLEQPMWQRMWNTQDAVHAAALHTADAERHGRRQQATCRIDGDALEIECQAPVLDAGWIGGHKAFASYLLLHRHEPDGPQALQANGRPLPDDLLDGLAEAAREQTADIAWQHGDVAIIDNTRCMHGRRAFEGNERRMLVRMGDVHPRLRT